MNILDKLTSRISGFLDDVTLTDAARRCYAEAESHVASGRADEALRSLSSLDSAFQTHWRTPFIRALAHERAGDFARAAEHIAEAAQARDSVAVRIAWGRICARGGELGAAREHLEAALAMNPADRERLDVLLGLADIHETTGPRARAIPVLKHATRLNPDDPALAIRLARALREDGDGDGALSVLGPLLARPTPPLDALRVAADVQRAEGRDHAAACRYLETVLRRDADDVTSLQHLADLYTNQGRIADALPVLHHALSVSEIDAHADIHVRVGHCYAQAESLDRAMDHYRAAVALQPDHLHAQLELATLALRAGVLVEADEASEAALASAPTARQAIAVRGRVLLARDRVDVARELLAPLRASQMSPNELTALGELALQSGDPIEAIALLRESSVAQAHQHGMQALLDRAYATLAPKLPTIPNIDELTAAQLAPFLEAMSGAVAAHALLVSLVPRTTALRQHLDTPLTVAILGEFNAGKSTLINAFLGEEVVAMGVLPTTSHVNVIRYGPRRVARWTDRDGEVSEIPYAEAARLVKRDPDAITRLEFLYPHPDLRAVHFWDTPGFNAPDSRHESRAERALETADAIVWMLDVNQALSQSELARLASIPNAQEKLLVAINKVDRLGDERDDAVSEVRAYVASGLPTHAGIFALSALRALQAKRDPENVDSVSLAQWGWTSFESAVRTSFYQRSSRLKALEVALDLRALIEEGLDHTTRADDDVRQCVARVEELRRDLTATRSRWTTHVSAPTHATFNQALQSLRRRTAREVRELTAPARRLFTRRSLPPEDRALALHQCVERATALYADSYENVLAHAHDTDAALVSAVETVASTIGPPESRTVRRRLEAYLAETNALRRLLRERIVSASERVLRARFDERGAGTFDDLAAGSDRTEAERDALLQRLLPTENDAFRTQIDTWAKEYIGAGLRLCDHVVRDLDILALDLEYRIFRPFRGVLQELGWSTDAHQRAMANAMSSGDSDERPPQTSND